MSVAWLLLAAALLVLPWPARSPPPAPDSSTVPRGRERRMRPALVAALAAATCLGVGGWPAGAVVGVPAAAATLLVVRRRAGGSTAISPDRELALVLDLCAAALRAGFPLADALTAAAGAGSAPVRAALGRVAGLLRLGASPGDAWAGLPPGSPLAPVVPVAVRSARSGLRLADAFERLAAELRVELAADAAARAHRAGVWAIAPLGACFLPSFVCLGIVPVVVGIARNATRVLP